MQSLMPAETRTHKHTFRPKRQCGAPACTRCGHHRDVKECLCGYVDPGVRRSKTPRLVFR